MRSSTSGKRSSRNTASSRTAPPSTSSSPPRETLRRAENELALATILLPLSEDKAYQENTLPRTYTFYSAAIAHAYYCIFYTAKAYLKKQGIRIASPREHEQTYERFAWFVDSGMLDKQLLTYYQDARTKAEALLDIFNKEKSKRTRFTYKKLPQANKAPANESVANATEFYKRINGLCGPNV